MRPAVPAAILAAALGACTPARTSFRCEAHGGAPWRVIHADHYTVVTDLEGPEARALARELEVMRSAVAASLFQRQHDPPVRATVVAFADRGAFETFAPAAALAYFAFGESEPKIVLPGRLGAEQRRVLAHEIAHHVAAYVLLRQPRWLAEGLACWAETLGEPPDGGELVVGTVPAWRRVRTRPQRITARELLAWGDDVPSQRLGAYYDAAWLLVSYLSARHPDRLAAYEGRLNGAEDPSAAFREIFPEWDPERPGRLEFLDDELDRWARAGQFQPRPVPATGATALRESHLPPAEVHALRLLLWPGGATRAGDEEAWRAEAGEALSEDPVHPVVLRLLADRDRLDPVPLARASTDGHPGDARAWTFLAGALPPSAVAEREAALRRAAELAPDSASIQAELARVLLEAGRSGEALPAARRAVQLAPHAWPVLEAYAAVVADLGQCGQALLAARRALDLLPAEAPSAVRDRLRAVLAGYAERCAGAAP